MGNGGLFSIVRKKNLCIDEQGPLGKLQLYYGILHSNVSQPQH